MACSLLLVALGGCTAAQVQGPRSDGAAPAPASVPPAAAPRPPNPRPNVYRDTLRVGRSPAVTGVPERIYVPNSKSASVDVIDPQSFKVVAHDVVGQSPQHVTPSWDLRRLYVDDTYSNELTALDPRTGTPTGKPIPVADPYNLYFTPDGRTAIVVAERFGRLDCYDPRTWRLRNRVAIPAAGPDHLDFSADGRFLVVSTEFSGWLFKVSTTSMRVTGRAYVGGLPVDVRLSPDGTVFYVANQGLGGVTLLNAATLRPIGFLATGSGAHGLAVSRDTRRLYVSNRLAGTISVVSFASRTVEATWRVGGSPDMLQVTPSGNQLWVSNRFNASVSVIDTTTGRALRVIQVGSSPHGLALFPQPGRMSLGHNGVYR